MKKIQVFLIFSTIFLLISGCKEAKKETTLDRTQATINSAGKAARNAANNTVKGLQKVVDNAKKALE